MQVYHIRSRCQELFRKKSKYLRENRYGNAFERTYIKELLKSPWFECFQELFHCVVISVKFHAAQKASWRNMSARPGLRRKSGKPEFVSL